MTEKLPETLKPFFERALQAEERLGRLEAALLASKTDSDSGNADLLEKMGQLQSMLEEANKLLQQEQLKVKELTAENDKHKYRMQHLLRSLRAVDDILENNAAEATTR